MPSLRLVACLCTITMHIFMVTMAGLCAASVLLLAVKVSNPSGGEISWLQWAQHTLWRKHTLMRS